jgi:hypothetical protein
MHPSRTLDRSLVLVLAGTLAGLSLGACGASTSPSLLPGVASAAPSITVASVQPASSAASDPTGSSDPIGSGEPTDVPEPTEAPTPTPSPIAGCGTGETGFVAHRSEIPKTLAFGHATIEFTSAGVSMRDGSHDADDVIPGGVGLTADEIAVVVAPGDHVILRATARTLVATTAVASPWSDVSFAGGLAGIGGPATTLAIRARADGSLSVSAPSKVGDWAITFYPRWHGDCLQGDGTAYARIKVR